MALKGQISLTILSVCFLVFELSIRPSSVIAPQPGTLGARSAAHTQIDPLADLVDSPRLLLGVSFQEGVDFSVVQQPAGDTNFVSKNDGEVTQFSSPNRYGNIGLLAHNYLSGKSFSQLRLGQKIHLHYSDGSIEDFTINEILRYKALDPKSPYSSFQNLDNQDEILTVGQMFDRAYQGNRHVTFQTCIAADGISSWGRLFIIATPDPADTRFHSASLMAAP
jgi:hypothetical protein